MRKEEAMDFLDNTKVYVHGKGEKIQDKLFEIGFTWRDGTTVYDHTEAQFLYITDKKMTYGLELVTFREKEAREVSVDDILNIKIDKFMKKEQKVWIQGDSDRGKEIITKLESLGGNNKEKCTGTIENRIYFIHPDGNIKWAEDICEIGGLVKDNYEEYKLPQEYQFSTFDNVLVKHTMHDTWDLYSYAYEDDRYMHFVGGTAFLKADYQFLLFDESTKHLLGKQ